MRPALGVWACSSHDDSHSRIALFWSRSRPIPEFFRRASRARGAFAALWIGLSVGRRSSTYQSLPIFEARHPQGRRRREPTVFLSNAVAGYDGDELTGTDLVYLQLTDPKDDSLRAVSLNPRATKWPQEIPATTWQVKRQRNTTMRSP